MRTSRLRAYFGSQSPVVLPLSTVIQLRGGVPHMPYVAHKRLVPVIHTPVHTFYYSGSVIPVRIHSRVRPSVLAAEINRIRDLWRPSTESYVEKFLNSKDNIYFDDEAREIRARVDSLLRRVHVYIPRASPSDFAEEIIPERMRSDDYVRRLLSGRNNLKKEMEAVSWYEVPERGNFGNLACVKYVAGKPHSIRRPYYKVADLRPSDIKNDVNLLSYYSKNRQAAANASPDEPKTDRELRKARALETEWSEAIAKREAQKAQKAMEEEAKKNKEEEQQQAEKEETKVEEKIVEKATARVEEPAKEAPKEAEEPAREAEQRQKEAEAPSEEAAPAAEPVKKTKAKKDIKKRAVEPVQKEQPAPEPVQKEEPAPEPAPEPAQKEEPAPEPAAAPVQKEEPAPEPAPEPVQQEEPVPEPVQKEEPASDAAPEPTPEPVQKEEPIAEPVQEQEPPPTEQSSTETAQEAELPTQKEAEEPQESKEEETKAETESAEPVSEEKEQNEEDQSDSVRQQKKEAIKRAEEYLAKLEEESKTEEERRQAAEDERLRLEIEERKAWEALQIDQERKAHLDEIIEQEKAEEQRKTEERKIAAERAEVERIETAERLLNAQKLALLIQQQERMIVEERAEEEQKFQKQEREEKSAEVALNGIGESKEYDCSCDDQLTGEITDQEREERPYDLVMEDDTRIEEENAMEDEVDDIPADPFVEEPRGAEESQPVEGGTAMNDGPKIEEVTSGGEESFEWGDEDA